MLLRLEGCARSVAGRTLFEGASLEVRRGDRLGLVGPNGAGKTTLLRILSGDEEPDRGRVSRARRVRVGLLRQEIDPRPGRSVLEEVGLAFSQLDALEREMRELEAEMHERGRLGRELPEGLADRYDRCRTAFEFGGGFAREARAERVLEGLGFDAAARAKPLSSFSGGWLMRVELAKLLLAAPDVLLLDEPTNHLDLPSIEWFEGVLSEYRGAVVLVSHDRFFLRRHATRVAELERGNFALYEGSYDLYVTRKRERRTLLAAQRRNQDRRVEETRRFIERFRYKASKARQVQSRVRSLEKLDRIEVPEDDDPRMRLRIPAPPRSGDEVLRLCGVHKRYGDRPVYAGLDLLVRRGERVALVGPNGSGKSTLLRIAAGTLPIDAGERHLGHNARVAFFAQHQRDALRPERTVLEQLESASHRDDVPRLRSHLGAFLFSGDDVDKKVAVLSGGERSRLALAALMLRPANFLVLDEPTNHLDVAACEVLEAALQSYTGTLLFVSHDRAFINALATRVLEVRAGVLRDFPGNYDRYLATRGSDPEPRAPEGRAQPAAGERSSEDPKRARIQAREEEREALRRHRRAERRVAALEERIARSEAELSALDRRLADPEVYRDGDAVRAARAERAESRAALEVLYREWELLGAELEAAG